MITAHAELAILNHCKSVPVVAWALVTGSRILDGCFAVQTELNIAVNHFKD